MTSNDMSSASPKTNGQGPMTYERLQEELPKLRAAVLALGSQGWEDLEVWFQAERQYHLEALVDSDEPDRREYHRNIAVWMKHFITFTKEQLISIEHADRNPVPAGDPDSMDFDSDSVQESPSSSGSVPAGAQTKARAYSDEYNIDTFGTFATVPRGKPVIE